MVHKFQFFSTLAIFFFLQCPYCGLERDDLTVLQDCYSHIQTQGSFYRRARAHGEQTCEQTNMTSAELADSLLEFLNDDTNGISIDESIIFSTLIHVDGDNYFWNGELSQLKRFVQNILKLTGTWTSPGGDTKQFKSNEVTLKWSGQMRRKLVIIKDTEANLVANTLINLFHKQILFRAKFQVIKTSWAYSNLNIQRYWLL